MAVTYEIDRATYGVDHYMITFDDDEDHSEEIAIDVVSADHDGSFDFHEDVGWGEYTVVAVYEEG